MIYSIREKLAKSHKSSSPFRTSRDINHRDRRKKKNKNKKVNLEEYSSHSTTPIICHFPCERGYAALSMLSFSSMGRGVEEGERRRRRRVWINSDNKGVGRSRSKPRESGFIRPLSGLSSFIQNRFRGTTSGDRSTVLDPGSSMVEG